MISVEKVCEFKFTAKKPPWTNWTLNLRCWIQIYQVEFEGRWKPSQKLAACTRKLLCQLSELLTVLVNYQNFKQIRPWIHLSALNSHLCTVLEWNERENKFLLSVFPCQVFILGPISRPPPPHRISIDLPWGVCGYFLEPHNVLEWWKAGKVPRLF